MLSRVTKLQEIAGTDTCVGEPFSSNLDFANPQALIHGVEHSLRSGFNAHPDFGTARTFKARDRLLAHKIGTRLDLERQSAVPQLNRIGELLDPSQVESEDVIAEPDMLRSVYFFELTDFSSHQLRRTKLKLVPGNGLGTPVAPVRASAARNHIRGEVAMRRHPGFPVWFQVDEFACRPDQVLPVRIAWRLGRALHQVPLGIQVDHAGYFLWQRIPGKNRSAQLHQALLRFSHQNKVSSILQILSGMVRRIRAMSDHDRPRLPCCLRQLPGHVAHPCQTHLRQEVEVVFIDGEDPWLLLPQHLEKTPDRILQHGIEDRSRDSMFP